MSSSFIDVKVSAGAEAPPEVEIRRNSPNSPWTYQDLDLRQRERARSARLGERGALLLSEVAPVITLGRRTPDSDLLFSREELASSGVAVCATDRGGLATYHGPGQWVLFAVDRLERLVQDRRGVRKAVCALLNTALDVASRYEPRAEIRDGKELGVWSPRGKLASVGIHIEGGVMLHGLAVNVMQTPSSFVGLRPCGLDRPADFLLNSAASADFDQVGLELKEAALRRFWPHAHASPERHGRG